MTILKLHINVDWDWEFFAILPALNINLHFPHLEFEWLWFAIYISRKTQENSFDRLEQEVKNVEGWSDRMSKRVADTIKNQETFNAFWEGYRSGVERGEIPVAPGARIEVNPDYANLLAKEAFDKGLIVDPEFLEKFTHEINRDLGNKGVRATFTEFPNGDRAMITDPEKVGEEPNRSTADTKWPKE